MQSLQHMSRVGARVSLAMLVCLTVSTARSAPAAGDADDFARVVRPILAAHCLKCHGPDEAHREGGLRLDVRQAAVSALDSGEHAIVPHDADASELVRRIFSTDPDVVMPPPAAMKPLSAKQKQILRDWISRGANYTPHWAFVAPRRSTPPPVKHQQSVRNPIDNFILARLEEAGIEPSAPADKWTLVRRLYLDLIGLPPTREQADEFVYDSAPDAYERLVDKLLNSPHYGERWAMPWLDLARYADSNGFDHDSPRSIWPYRDWVINSLNADMPFDQFTIEQIAGDMLPDATLNQKIATGFHRNTLLNDEGGTDPLEYRFYSYIDRVNTTATTWLGLTLGCAQCHTHKYDPIPHADYYRFMALLNNTEEPQLEVPQPDIIARRAAIEAQIATIENNLVAVFPLPSAGNRDAPQADDSENLAERREHFSKKFEAWRNEATKRAVHWTVLRPTQVASSRPRLTVLGDDSVLASGDQSKSETYDLSYSSELQGVTGIRLEAIPDKRLPAGGPGLAYYVHPGNFILSELTLSTDDVPHALTNARQSYDLAAPHAKVGAASAIDGNRQSGWGLLENQIGRAYTAVFKIAKPLDSARSLHINMLFEEAYACCLGRFRVSITTDPLPDSIGSWSTEIETLLTLPLESLSAAQRDQLERYYLSIAPELAPYHEEIAKLRAQMPALPTTLVLEERAADNRRPTFLHRRGEYLQPTDPVEADVLSILPPLKPGVAHNRLELARWLVSTENPLTARVAVNRFWAAFFGAGLVRTVNDFGYQGDPPTHPELLDWLSVEFMDSHWSVKALHRLIVTSATYRQSSFVSGDARAKDIDNRLLSRGPRHRLAAEQIRDVALCASGLLTEALGGPGVFPPQPPGVTTDGLRVPFKWETSSGPDRYRRGLYTFAKRATPFAMFAAFDAPNGSVCVAQRQTSTSPLQALTLLNDTLILDAAKNLAKLTTENAKETPERLEYLFRRCLTRPPSSTEQAQIRAFYEVQKQRFANHELPAAELAGVNNPESIERAAWAAVARSLLNLDETISKE